MSNTRSALEIASHIGMVLARLEADESQLQRLLEAAGRGAFVLGTYDLEKRIDARRAQLDDLRWSLAATVLTANVVTACLAGCSFGLGVDWAFGGRDESRFWSPNSRRPAVATWLRRGPLIP